MNQFALFETNVIDASATIIPNGLAPSIVCPAWAATDNVGVPAVFLITNIAVFPTAVGNVIVNAPPDVDAKITLAPDVAVSVYVVVTDVTE
jgi:hypothetical protein